MKLLILVLLSLGTFSIAQGQEDEPSETLQNNITLNNDYLISLLFNISEARLPNYLVEVIYNRPLEKGISSQAVLNLYRANNITINSTQNILQLLSISQTQFFSLNNFNYTLGLLNWTFTNFYNTLTNRLNLSGTPLRNGLIALNIDVNQFSAGITWGDPDPWQEFIKGNFTETNLQLACSEAEITLEALWAGIRDLFINDLVTLDVTNFVQLLVNHNIRQQEALVIWNAVPVTLEHVYSLALFNNIIGNFSARITTQTALGVITGAQEVVVHRSIHDVFKEERELLNIQAQTLLTGTTLDIGTINDSIYRNLVVLRHNISTPFTNLTVIPVASRNANLTNCSYVTFQNNNILTINVSSATFRNETYVLPRATIENVVSGSALVCNSTVYGLTRGVEGDAIIVDAFSSFVAPDNGSAKSLSTGVQMITNCAAGLVLLICSKFLMF